MELYEKLVEFNKWCSKCKYFKEPEWRDTCNECLNNPVNDCSHKPINYKEKEEKKHE